jgi:hypothetical protein
METYRARQTQQGAMSIRISKPSCATNSTPTWTVSRPQQRSGFKLYIGRDQSGNQRLIPPPRFRPKLRIAYDMRGKPKDFLTPTQSPPSQGIKVIISANGKLQTVGHNKEHRYHLRRIARRDYASMQKGK